MNCPCIPLHGRSFLADHCEASCVKDTKSTDCVISFAHSVVCHHIEMFEI